LLDWPVHGRAADAAPRGGGGRGAGAAGLGLEVRRARPSGGRRAERPTVANLRRSWRRARWRLTS